MKRLKEEFEQSFGIPLSTLNLPDIELLPLDGEPDESLLFGSEIASENPYLIQSWLDDFIEHCPNGYFLVGFWGHGMNSHAFYYSRVDDENI